MSEKTTPQAFYDNLAPKYDATLSDAKINAQYVKEAVKIFQRHHQDSHGTVLDVGCGTGFLKELLKEKEFEYTGIDISEKILQYAAERGYGVIHSSLEEALPQIQDSAYDFVFALGALLFVEDIHSILSHIDRIARRSIVLSFDELPDDYIQSFAVPTYNHANVEIPYAIEDYFIRGWTSPTTGVTVQTRMIYIEKMP